MMISGETSSSVIGPPGEVVDEGGIVDGFIEDWSVQLPLTTISCDEQLSTHLSPLFTVRHKMQSSSVGPVHLLQFVLQFSHFIVE
jgi:hypothetical protein